MTKQRSHETNIVDVVDVTMDKFLTPPYMWRIRLKSVLCQKFQKVSCLYYIGKNTLSASK